MQKLKLKNLKIFFKKVLIRIFVFLVFIVTIFLLKYPFYKLALPKLYDFKNHNLIKDDILSRKEYLLNKTINSKIRDESSTNLGILNSSTIKSEWDLGTYSMLALALTNIAIRYNDEIDATKKSLESLLEIVFDKRFQEFENNFFKEYPLESLENGHIHIAYLAHVSLILGGYKRLGGEKYQEIYDKIIESLVKKFKKIDGLCEATYPNEYYFPDNVAAMGSIAIYSKLNNDKYKDFLDIWIKLYKEKESKSEYKLLPFWLDSKCNFIYFPRASSSFWNVYFLSFIDYEWAKEEYFQAKKVLYQRGIFEGFREAPKGILFYGDVDSGPSPFGLSPSGNGFAMSGATLFNDNEALERILKLGEFVGTSVNTKEGKRYLLAPLVGDAIILAMRTHTLWF